jgi:uncharacterized damage-inducible protein DinB
MAMKDTLLAEYDHETATTRRLLERIPDDKLTFVPHPRSMTLGRLASHFPSVLLWTNNVLNEPSFDLASGPPETNVLATRSEILSAYDAARARARGWMDRTDAELVAPWTLRRGEQQMFTLPRIAALRTFVLNHLIHHRGQLSVYLRLNDIPVPPIYGPSADEG